MEKYAGGRFRQFAGTDAHRGRAVRDLCADRDRLLDGWLVIRKPVVRGSADDVRAALFQPLFFPHDGQDLSRAHDHGPGFHHDPYFKYGDLYTVVTDQGLQIILVEEVVPFIEFEFEGLEFVSTLDFMPGMDARLDPGVYLFS